MRRQNRADWYNIALSAAVAAVAVVSGIYAVHFWIRRGVCIDSVVCATAAILSAATLALFVYRLYAVRRIEQMSQRPIYLVMVSGPKGTAGKKEVKGKMPKDLHR